jgi:hypothetical protein
VVGPARQRVGVCQIPFRYGLSLELEASVERGQDAPHRRPDDHFAAEAAAARDAGIAVALIDHDALADPGGAQRAAARVPDAGGAVVYFGWMMSSASYASLAAASFLSAILSRS